MQQKRALFKRPDEIIAFETTSLLPKADKVWRAYSGNKGGVHPRIENTIDAALQLANKLTRPQAVRSRFSRVREIDTWFSSGYQDIWSPIDLVKSLAVVCTIGRALEAQAKLFAKEGDYLASYILVLIGTLATAKLSDQVTALIQPKGYVLRAAPGDSAAVCPGRPLVNSIGGETKILKENLPIVSEHKVPVIALCIGQEGIPTGVDGRLRIAHQILDAAVQAGVKQEDVVFDPLVMTVGADDQAVRVALETIRRLRREFPENNIAGGASNVNFGMPPRPILNANFLVVAATLGMNMPITDPTDTSLRIALRSVDIFLGRDSRTRSYMQHYRSMTKEPDDV